MRMTVALFPSGRLGLREIKARNEIARGRFVHLLERRHLERFAPRSAELEAAGRLVDEAELWRRDRIDALPPLVAKRSAQRQSLDERPMEVSAQRSARTVRRNQTRPSCAR